ncbi:hypothetical protein [Cronobacter universalis]|uniref:hypothetical protein n=1 Tax=Cronobacter universalis TaxID=535744 RepID=UPI003CFAB18E
MPKNTIAVIKRSTCKLVVWGKCDFETTGIEYLLTAEGYRVGRWSMAPPSSQDILLVALSAEPLLNWGRNLKTIEAMQKIAPCRGIIILVPTQLRELKAPVPYIRFVDGCKNIECLMSSINKIICEMNNGFQVSCASLFSSRQSRYLIKMKKNITQNRKSLVNNKNEYYHLSRLVKISGMPNRHVILVAGHDILRIYTPGRERLLN